MLLFSKPLRCGETACGKFQGHLLCICHPFGTKKTSFQRCNLYIESTGRVFSPLYFLIIPLYLFLSVSHKCANITLTPLFTYSLSYLLTFISERTGSKNKTHTAASLHVVIPHIYSLELICIAWACVKQTNSSKTRVIKEIKVDHKHIHIRHNTKQKFCLIWGFNIWHDLTNVVQVWVRSHSQCGSVFSPITKPLDILHRVT